MCPCRNSAWAWRPFRKDSGFTVEWIAPYNHLPWRDMVRSALGQASYQSWQQQYHVRFWYVLQWTDKSIWQKSETSLTSFFHTHLDTSSFYGSRWFHHDCWRFCNGVRRGGWVGLRNEHLQLAQRQRGGKRMKWQRAEIGSSLKSMNCKSPPARLCCTTSSFKSSSSDFRCFNGVNVFAPVWARSGCKEKPSRFWTPCLRDGKDVRFRRWWCEPQIETGGFQHKQSFCREVLLCLPV